MDILDQRLLLARRIGRCAALFLCRCGAQLTGGVPFDRLSCDQQSGE